jgi:hypothetical protein
MRHWSTEKWETKVLKFCKFLCHPQAVLMLPKLNYYRTRTLKKKRKGHLEKGN